MRQVRLAMENIKITKTRIRKVEKTPEEYEILKKSIKRLGLSNPIIVTQRLELIDGFYRLKIFKELHEEDPRNVEFYDIPTLVVLPREEVEALKRDFFQGTDYMRDTAIDRLNILYDPRLFDGKEIHEYLGIPQLEFEHRLEIGDAIRDNLDSFLFEDYRKEQINHEELYARAFLEDIDDVIDEVVDSEKLDVDEWL